MSSNPNPSPAVGVPVNSLDGPQAARIVVPWSSGLCDCFDDVPNCCITFWCPCITFGQISEIVDQGASSCAANGGIYFLIACISLGLLGCNCACFYSCVYRTQMRVRYSLEEGALGDCLVHCLCEPCALCQEYRELKHRGYDMTLGVGWHGNMERQRQTAQVGMTSMPPVVEQGMTRDKA